MQNLLVFDPKTGIILAEGVVDPEAALPAEDLPEGSVYVDAFPPGTPADWLFRDGEFVPAPKEGSAE